MGKSVVDLLKNMSSRELTMWMAYYSCEPWGTEVEGTRHAVTASTIANVGLGINNPKKLRRSPFKPSQFAVGGLRGRDLSSTHKKRRNWKDQRDRLLKALGLGAEKNARK